MINKSLIVLGLTLVQSPSLCYAQGTSQQSLQNAIIEQSLHKFSDAESSYREALSKASTSQQELSALKGLGIIYLNQGKDEEAASHFKRAAEIESNIPNCDPAIRSATLCNLAFAYRQSGRMTDAEPVYRSALEFAQQSGKKTSEATALDHLAVLYSEAGRFADADLSSRKAVNLAESAWGPESVNTALIIGNRGFALGLQGRYREAEIELKKAMSVCEKLLGVENNNVVSVAADLARVYLTQGKLKEAKALYERSIATRRKLSGADVGVASMTTYLSRVYLESGEIEKARLSAEEALNLYEHEWGKADTRLWTALVALSSAYEMKGDTTKALELAEQALAKSRSHKVLLLMAKIQKDRGDLTKAEQFAREAVSTCQKQFGSDHPELARCDLGLADVLKAKHSDLESQEFVKKANSIKAKNAKLNAPK